MAEHRDQPVEIDIGSTLKAVTFSAKGEYLLSGGLGGVRVWRVRDGKQMAAMTAGMVRCLAVSKDGRWFAAGTDLGDMIVWDAKTYRQAFSHMEYLKNIFGIDFSPDSTRLVVGTSSRTATILDISTQKGVKTIDHEDEVIATKYSPLGDRIATATRSSVQIYDNDGRLLGRIKVNVTPWYNTGLLWSSDQLFVVSDSKIKQIDASTGSVVSQGKVPCESFLSCIALPQHGEFVVYSAIRAVSFLDRSTHAQLGLIQQSQDICSVALSPDDRLLAIGKEKGKVTIRRLPYITGLDIQIDDASLDSWKQDQFADAETLLTAAILTSQNPTHALVSRSLVRSRLRQWDAAIGDAEKSIEVEPSVIGYIAKGVALVGKGEKHEAYRVCDIAFKHSYSSRINFLLLIKAVIVFMAGDHDDAISRVDDIVDAVRIDSTCHVVQACMHFIRGNLRMESGDYKAAIRLFERAQAQMRPHTSQALWVVSLVSGWKFDDLGITIRRHLCEALYASGHIKEAGESLLNIINTVGERAYVAGPVNTWVSDFVQRYLSTPQCSSDTALYSPSLTPLLEEWAKLKLTCSSWKDAAAAAHSFTTSRFMIYRVLCDHLEMTNRTTDAIECFYEMGAKFVEEMEDEQAGWVLDFKSRCCKKLEVLGDATMSDGKHDEAIGHYSDALSLNPTAQQVLLVKRSKARATIGQWQDALNDANEAIALDSSSPLGYERKYVASRGAGNHKDTLDAFETMLLKMSESSDPEIRERCQQYTKTKETIRTVIQDTIRESPLVLINTDSGRLCNKSEQAAAFELLPVFTELISSMTAGIDRARIEREVADYYRYAMFSHKWEDNEPLFERVINLVIYELEKSPTHDKLQTFCKIVRDSGLRWAWSDTCCINKADHFVLQEAIVAMFKWYEGSAVTIVLLRGVHSPSRHGDLVQSIWNSRAWTFQEYHASKVVRFYTEDWKPYMNLDVPNHKEAPEIILEMEEATGISAPALMALRPGLDDIREKLRLASTRRTTRVEDAAYSLLGIFSMSLSVVYGEGDKALGRLLAQLLASSGDSSILAWTGESGSFNSCLPAYITVFDGPSTSHLPPPIEDAELENTVSTLRSSSIDVDLAVRLYDRLNELPAAWFAASRMKLPCIAFKLPPLSRYRTRSGRVYRTDTPSFGMVEIHTRQKLSRLDFLYLVHPWLDTLLDHDVQSGTLVEDGVAEQSAPNTDDEISDEEMEDSFANPSSPDQDDEDISDEEIEDDSSSLSASGSPSPPRMGVPPVDKETRALRLIARLRQPFVPLLLTLTSTGRRSVVYKRVAADSATTVQLRENVPLNDLLVNVRVLDVL